MSDESHNEQRQELDTSGVGFICPECWTAIQDLENVSFLPCGHCYHSGCAEHATNVAMKSDKPMIMCGACGLTFTRNKVRTGRTGPLRGENDPKFFRPLYSGVRADAANVMEKEMISLEKSAEIQAQLQAALTTSSSSTKDITKMQRECAQYHSRKVLLRDLIEEKRTTMFPPSRCAILPKADRHTSLDYWRPVIEPLKTQLKPTLVTSTSPPSSPSRPQQPSSGNQPGGGVSAPVGAELLQQSHATLWEIIQGTCNREVEARQRIDQYSTEQDELQKEVIEAKAIRKALHAEIDALKFEARRDAVEAQAEKAKAAVPPEDPTTIVRPRFQYQRPPPLAPPRSPLERKRQREDMDLPSSSSGQPQQQFLQIATTLADDADEVIDVDELDDDDDDDEVQVVGMTRRQSSPSLQMCDSQGNVVDIPSSNDDDGGDQGEASDDDDGDSVIMTQSCPSQVQHTGEPSTSDASTPLLQGAPSVAVDDGAAAVVRSVPSLLPRSRMTQGGVAARMETMRNNRLGMHQLPKPADARFQVSMDELSHGARPITNSGTPGNSNAL